ncbi:MAG: tRNA-(ms[2]io[6]A)-hydroxylase [Oleiphilaceae bacterium]|jgi:tRNA-(ms[2]io[6]A)-hydroxylase
MQDLTEIKEFLGSETPDLWVQNAIANQAEMLIDHAHCEKKAATTALNLINRYPHDDDLLMKMSRLAREELRHFEQVLKFLKKRGIRYTNFTASRYAAKLRDHVRKQEPEKIADIMIIGAFIEARSCERFAKIAPLLETDLSEFYISLLKSESRHYQDYLTLAKKYAKKDILERVAYFRAIENKLIAEPDTEFRFHSGPVSA